MVTKAQQEFITHYDNEVNNQFDSKGIHPTGELQRYLDEVRQLRKDISDKKNPRTYDDKVFNDYVTRITKLNEYRSSLAKSPVPEKKDSGTTNVPPPPSEGGIKPKEADKADTALKVIQYKHPSGVTLTSEPRKAGGNITEIILHDTEEIGVQRTFEVLNKRNLAYHYVIDTDGTVYEFVNPDFYISHAGGANEGTIGISFVGGDPEDYAKRLREGKDPTLPKGNIAPANDIQQTSAVELMKNLKTRYPTITMVEGHNDVEARLGAAGVKKHKKGNKSDPVGVNVKALAERAGLHKR